MSKEFENILDECLERLLVNGESLEQCLQSYPAQAADLEPLLQVALDTKEAASIQPRPEFKARARYQFQAALQEMVENKRGFFSSWLPRWATVVTAVLIVLLAGGGMIAAASYDSMPDDLLYPVKLATEQIQLTMTFSDIGKANLNAKLADRRVAEIVYMADKGDNKKLEAITQQLDKRLAILARITSSPQSDKAPKMLESATEAQAPPGLTTPEEAAISQDTGTTENKQAKIRTVVANYAISHPARLRAAMEKAPESARSALRRAINVAKNGYEKTIKGWD